MKTLGELRAWTAAAPRGTLIPAERLLEVIDELDLEPAVPTPGEVCLPSWRERFWAADPDVRIGKQELLEAVGRTESWLYRRTGPRATNRMPHRKIDGQLVFVVGEVRRWLRDREEIIEAGPVDPSRRLRLHAGAQSR